MPDTETRTPRKPQYRTGPATQPWHRDFHNAYEGKHRLGLFTPFEETVAALRERHGREA